MQDLPYICFMCLRDGNVKKLSFPEQDILFNQFVKYVLPEYIVPEHGHSLYICSICQFSLQSFYKFKKMCLKNNQKEILSESEIEVHDEQDDLYTIRMDNEGDEEEILSVKQEMKNEDVQQFETTEVPMKTTSPKCEMDSIQNDAYILRSFKHSENQIGSSDVESKVFDNFYKCCICYKVFLYKYAFNSHLERHIGVKQYYCATCNKSFASMSTLNRHKTLHTSAEIFECAVCLKKFAHKRYLVQHIECHIGTKKFQCSFCNRKFLKKRYLEEHEKIHRDIKDFKCSICGKEFRQKVNLNKHVLIHSGIKKYGCLICNKKFTEKCALNRHLKIHTKKTK